MKRSIHVHALAEADLIEIWEYSAAQWNAEQADTYLDDLDRAIRSLLDNPEIGARRDHVREGYRVLFVRRHAVLLQDHGTHDPRDTRSSRPDGRNEALAVIS